MYDLAYKGMESQNWQKALGPTGQCLYLTKDSLKCAIGHTIPGIETYTRERWFVGDVTRIPQGVLDTAASYGQLADLQTEHDGASSPENCKARFKDYAIRHNLTVPE
jgi:hypothetical protein